MGEDSENVPRKVLVAYTYTMSVNNFVVFPTYGQSTIPCERCEQENTLLIEVGGYYKYDDSPQRVCRTCLQAAIVESERSHQVCVNNKRARELQEAVDHEEEKARKVRAEADTAGAVAQQNDNGYCVHRLARGSVWS